MRGRFCLPKRQFNHALKHGHPVKSTYRQFVILKGSFTYTMSVTSVITRLSAIVLFPILSLLSIWSLLDFEGDVILFNAYLFDHYEVFTLDVERDILHRVTYSEDNTFSPTWSPDGDHIAYIYQRDIYLTDPSGRAPRNLTQTERNISNSMLAWSPDSDAIAFLSDRNSGAYELYLLEAPTNHAETTQLTTNDVVTDTPNWSNDGNQLVYATENGVFQLNLEAESSGIQAFLPQVAQNLRVPVWSPQNPDLLAVVDGESSNNRLLLIDMAQNDVRVLVENVRINTQPIWSPKGDYIALTQTTRTGQSALILLDVADDTRTALHSVGQNVIDSPSWSSDGTWVLFRSNFAGGTGVYRIPRTGGDPQRLSPREMPLVFDPAWRP